MSKLFEAIMELAESKRVELKGRVLTLDYVYCAMAMIVEKPDLLSGKDIDEEEVKEFREMLLETSPHLSCNEIVEKIKERKQTDEDISEAKNFIRMAGFKKWSATDALIKLKESGCYKDIVGPDAAIGVDDNQAVKKNIGRTKGRKTEKEENAEETETEETEAEETKTSDEESVEEPVQSVFEIVKKAAALRNSLLGNVIGQDYAVRQFVEGYFQGEVIAQSSQNRRGPKAIFLFAGSPGVGKTFLAESAAGAIGIESRKFDMSSYTTSESINELTGSISHMVGSEEGKLTGFVRRNPKSIIIFDEIEKADSRIINLFLQILDSGTLYDNKTKKNVSFLDTIVIFTTNAGKQLYQDTTQKNLSSTPKSVILGALKKDINPATGQPFFPEAICSRFSTGSVIMFNHLTAEDLIHITRRELVKNQENFNNTYEVTSNGADILDSTILYSLGGNCDARNATAAARKFFSAEMFELLRLVNDHYGEEMLASLEKVDWEVDFSNASEEVKSLYQDSGDENVLIFGLPKNAALGKTDIGSEHIFYASETEAAKEILQKNEIAVVLIDYYFTPDEGQAKWLNAEDILSEGRRAFEMVRTDYPEIPVYIWEADEHKYSAEEKLSLASRGASDIVAYDPADGDDCAKKLREMCRSVYEQRAMDTLALKHQVLSYETAQDFTLDGKRGKIIIFDLKLKQAVESEDRKVILSAEEKPSVHWDDVVISEVNKKELQYFINYLKNPKAFMAKGQRAPKGLLMYGPPGTGKTTLAKVAATESDVTFLAVGADQFISRWAGEGPENVHRMFATARKYAPAILFIDEIDAIGKARREDAQDSSGIHEILNALLTEMDGFKTAVKKPVFVMAATNLGGRNGKTGALDAALVRRFDNSINIDLPDKEGRIKVFKLLCRKNPILKISDAEIESLAIRSVGMSPANLEGAVETAIRGAIQSDTVVDDALMDEAFERYIMGEEKKWQDSELMKTARHEAGHALICNYYGEKPSYLTIVARDDHGGYMLHGDLEGKGTYTKADILHRICTSLGGRAAEIVYYGDEEGMTTGPSSDIDNATRLARAMICTYGMYSEIGIAAIGSGGAVSEEMLTAINRLISNILEEQLECAKRIILENRDKVDNLVKALMEKQHLTEEQIQEALK